MLYESIEHRAELKLSRHLSNCTMFDLFRDFFLAFFLGCKVGLAESCSHIARVLFYFEAWTKVKGRLSCMKIKCLGYFPVSQTRWNTLVSAILTLNPLRK